MYCTGTHKLKPLKLDAVETAETADSARGTARRGRAERQAETQHPLRHSSLGDGS